MNDKERPEGRGKVLKQTGTAVQRPKARAAWPPRGKPRTVNRIRGREGKVRETQEIRTMTESLDLFCKKWKFTGGF